MKILAILLGLSAAVCAQRVSIGNLSNQHRNLKVSLPENCLGANSRQECVKCLNNFEVKAGKCVAVVNSQYRYAFGLLSPLDPPSGFVFYREDQLGSIPSSRQ